MADVVLFRQLRATRVLSTTALTRASFLTRQQIARTEVRWQIELPSTFDDYLASLSSATRKGIRRTVNAWKRRSGIV